VEGEIDYEAWLNASFFQRSVIRILGLAGCQRRAGKPGIFSLVHLFLSLSSQRSVAAEGVWHWIEIIHSLL
jgi:hypothetical protein